MLQLGKYHTSNDAFISPYLILSSRISTTNSGRPCIFQYCLMNCSAF